MNKTEFIKELGAKVNLTAKQAGAVLDALTEIIVDQVKAGDKVQIAGLGSFELKQRSARTGVNPQTKEEITIPASKVPVFKPAKAFKEEVK
jgi:DNA-binding protein HU-beta